MDPLTALGIAAAVVQFVGFSADLLSTSKDIFKSPRGMTKNNSNTEEIYASLKDLSERLTTLLDRDDDENGGSGQGRLEDAAVEIDDVSEARDCSPGRPRHARSEFELLSMRCRDDCAELLKVLEGLMSRSGRNRPWQTAKAAIKSLLSQKKIAELESNIRRTRDIMSLHLQSLISSEVTDLKDSMKRLSTNSRSLSMQQADRLDAIEEGIASLTLSLQDPEVHKEESRRVPSTEHIERLATNMETTLAEQADARVEQQIVSSLHYEHYSKRYEDILPASHDTFGWIDESALVDWLHKGDGVFWRTGKAGSGKSTLMKFIAHHHGTRDCLEKWAAPKEAIIASHY